jgi:hypothetical protein
MDRYELHDRQERSAQDHVRWLKAFYTSLVVGVVFLILPRAVPWFSAGIPETAMGRPIEVIRNFRMAPFFVTGLLHMVLAIIYGYILAELIFRFEVRLAILIGAIGGIALYGINFAVFRLGFGTPPANEIAVAITHLFFSLVFSAAYKAASVPDANRVS